MRDYTRFDDYYSRLMTDLYPQEEDVMHTLWAEDAMKMLPQDAESLLDVGCGSGFCQKFWKKKYVGITASHIDYSAGTKLRHDVQLGDMNYLQFDDESFDVILARHILEHSPFPIISLMEWWRVSKKWLLLIMPGGDFWGWAGRNHYSVGSPSQIWWWLRRSGWQITTHTDFMTHDSLFADHYAGNVERVARGEPKVQPPGPPKIVEHRYLCIKTDPINV